MHLKVSTCRGNHASVLSQRYFESSSCTLILLEGLAITVALRNAVILENCGKIMMSESITVLLFTPLCMYVLFIYYYFSICI